jgi:hypothetical protein
VKPIALLAAVAALSLAAGCSSSGQKSAAPAPAPDAKKASADEMLGLRGPAPVEGEEGRAPVPKPYMDPELGKRVVRIERNDPMTQYYERDGRLFLAMVAGPGVPILRSEPDAWIVEAPPERKLADKNAEPTPPSAPILELPKYEAEAVTPKTSKDTLRFEEISGGLPRSGMWRENFDLGDVLGAGRPQIVAPPARLTGKSVQVFRLDREPAGAWKWKAVELELDNPENVDAAYGSATVADMDQDGRPDIIFGGHGSGPAIAFNQGNGKFRVETRGLPRQMSTRAIVVADLDRDGRPDLLAISDEMEWSKMGGKPAFDKDTNYERGYDVRAFLNDGRTFRDVHAGLEGACFGYSIAVAAPRDPALGLPFYASACRYVGINAMLYEFDAKAGKFHDVWYGNAENFTQHTGAAAGTYHGRPAVFASWFKRTPYGATAKIDGEGVTAYYRDTEGKITAKRVVKTLKFEAASYAITAGDLNGDGLDDVVWADEVTKRVRVFFQTPAGEFEELAAEREPVFVNHPTCLRIGDVDGDGRADVVLMYQYLTGDETRAGGFRVFRGLAK